MKDKIIELQTERLIGENLASIAVEYLQEVDKPSKPMLAYGVIEDTTETLIVVVKKPAIPIVMQFINTLNQQGVPT